MSGGRDRGLRDDWILRVDDDHGPASSVGTIIVGWIHRRILGDFVKPLESNGCESKTNEVSSPLSWPNEKNTAENNLSICALVRLCDLKIMYHLDVLLHWLIHWMTCFNFCLVLIIPAMFFVHSNLPKSSNLFPASLLHHVRWWKEIISIATQGRSGFCCGCQTKVHLCSTATISSASCGQDSNINPMMFIPKCVLLRLVENMTFPNILVFTIIPCLDHEWVSTAWSWLAAFKFNHRQLYNELFLYFAIRAVLHNQE